MLKGMRRDENGVAKPQDLRNQNSQSNGELVKLLSNRSAVYLRQKDIAAALEDAQVDGRINDLCTTLSRMVHGAIETRLIANHLT
eukprot:6076342-Amphidinium_carterae.1